MSHPPVLINDAAGWRLGRPSAEPKPRRKVVYRPQPVAPILPAQIRSMMQLGLDTVEIALRLRTTEAVIWNVMARART